MEMNWEEFEQGPEKNPAEIIHATLSTRGTIFLNRRAVEAIGEPDHVILMYDRRRCTIGIKSSPSSRQNAYRLKRKEKRTAAASSTEQTSAASTTSAPTQPSPSPPPKSINKACLF